MKKEKKHNTNDSRKSERLLDGKHTNSGRAGICYVDEAARKRGIYRQKSVRASRTDSRSPRWFKWLTSNSTCLSPGFEPQVGRTLTLFAKIKKRFNC